MSHDLFAGNHQPITFEDMRRCIERELAYRRRVYQNLIRTKKMTVAQAEREIEIMQAVLQLVEDTGKSARLDAEG